jgi:hypothetical protein
MPKKDNAKTTVSGEELVYVMVLNGDRFNAQRMVCLRLSAV